jgi:phosphate butyryltransferase
MGRRFSPFGARAARAGGTGPVVANPRPVEPVHTLDELIARAQALGPRVVAVPAAESETALQAVVEARRRGIARGLLFGDREGLEDRLWKLEEDPAHHEIVHEPDDRRAASLAVDRVRAGGASLLLKGRLPTGDLLRAVLDRDHGLRTGRILSDVMVSEHPTAPPRRIVGITDGGVNVAPRLAEKQAILENAVRVFHRLGFARPVVALLCAVETPSPAMPHTQDARALSEMAGRGEITGCAVVGPLALDNALLPWAARAKGIEHPLAGRADILLVPTIEAGNILGKAFSWLAGKPVAHVIEGARAPVLIPSRVERADDKLLSIALGVLSAEEAT